MKTRLTIFSVLLLSGLSMISVAQSTFTVFSEHGEKFTLFLNGTMRNDKPATRVDAEKPGGPTIKIVVRFEDTTIPEISKSIFNSPAPEMYYVIRKSDKGKYLLDKTSAEYLPAQEAGAKAAAATTTATTATTTQASETAKAEPAKEAEAKPAGEAKGGCPVPMNQPDFEASRIMISNAPFDPPRLSQAKNLADKHCLSTTQIIEMLWVFSGESSRLTFAKYAYKHCYDPANYGSVKDNLKKSNQEELQKYIDSQK